MAGDEVQVTWDIYVGVHVGGEEEMVDVDCW